MGPPAAAAGRPAGAAGQPTGAAGQPREAAEQPAAAAEQLPLGRQAGRVRPLAGRAVESTVGWWQLMVLLGNITYSEFVAYGKSYNMRAMKRKHGVLSWGDESGGWGGVG